MLSIHRSISVDAKEVLDELSTNNQTHPTHPNTPNTPNTCVGCVWFVLDELSTNKRRVDFIL